MIKKNLFNISIGLFFIFILVSYLFLLPKYREFLGVKAALDQKDKALSQKERYFLKLTDIAVKLDGFKEQLEKIDASLPDQLSEPAIINFLQKKSSENGLILEAVSSSSSAEQKDKKVKNAKKVSFSIELSGAYPSFKNFVSELYENERFFELESINFKAPSESSKDKLFKFEVVLGVYYFSEDKEEDIKTQSQGAGADMIDIKAGVMP